MTIHYVQFHLKYDPPHTHKAERGAHDAVVFERDFEEGVSPLSHLMRGFRTTAVIDPLLGGTSTRTLDWLARQDRIARSCATGQINTHTVPLSIYCAKRRATRFTHVLEGDKPVDHLPRFRPNIIFLSGQNVIIYVEGVSFWSGAVVV